MLTRDQDRTTLRLSATLNPGQQAISPESVTVVSQSEPRWQQECVGRDTLQAQTVDFTTDFV